MQRGQRDLHHGLLDFEIAPSERPSRRRSGLDPRDARGAPAAAVVRAFEDRFGREPEVVVRAPGRVNLLGAHVDVHEGWVLPAAIDRAVWLAAAPRPSGGLGLVAVDLGASRELAPLRSGGELPPAAALRSGDWTDLPRGVAWVLERDGHPPVSLDLAFGGDLPMGAGVSSSAAVEIAMLLAWRALAGLGTLDERDLARLARRVENEVLGVGSGIMDQLASLLGRRDHAILLDCRDLATELVPVPAAASVLVVDTGVRRRLAASGFDDRRRQAEEAADLLRARLPGMRTLRDVSPEDLDRLEGHLPPVLARRARHVVEECARVLAGAEDLRRGDLPSLGERMFASHRGSRDLYETSIPELDVLVDAARGPGCHGARLAGGGFGGCVLALVDRDAAEPVRRRMAAAFRERFGRAPEAFATGLAGGAGIVAGRRVSVPPP